MGRSLRDMLFAKLVKWQPHKKMWLANYCKLLFLKPLAAFLGPLKKDVKLPHPVILRDSRVAPPPLLDSLTGLYLVFCV